jgi:hypothetical protein
MAFKGGVKLKPTALFKTHKAGLTYMLKNGVVSLLSCDTTTSFLFILTANGNVPDAQLPFVNATTSKALRVLVLKFNILFPQCKLANFKCNGTLKKKKCVSDSIVYTEASVQQYIYLKTLSRPICPGIIFSDYLESPNILLDCVTDASSQAAIQYLMTYFVRRKIGLIVMDFVDPLKYSPLSYVAKEKKIDYVPRIGGAILKIAQLGYFNYDMHNNNILVAENALEIQLIDFGRVVQLSNLSTELAEEVQKRSPFDIFELIAHMPNPQFLMSKENAVKAFALLADIDLIQNNQLFGGMHIQMVSFVKHIFYMNNKESKNVLYDTPYNSGLVMQCILEYAKYNQASPHERSKNFFNVSKKKNKQSKYYV